MNEDKWVKCTKCNTPIKPVFEKDNAYLEQVDDGTKLIFAGGYGMFQDCINTGNPTAFLCHDCTVELLKFFPQEFREKFKGGHPWSHKPEGKCCEYALSFKKDN